MPSFLESKVWFACEKIVNVFKGFLALPKFRGNLVFFFLGEGQLVRLSCACLFVRVKHRSVTEKLLSFLVGPVGRPFWIGKASLLDAV